MRDETFMTLIRLLPRSALSAAVGVATRAPAPAKVHQAVMRVFAHQFRVDMNEAEHGFDAYRTFGEFFARGLKPGLRPIDPDERAVVSPVDGAVSQAGAIEGGECVQAKGITYSVSALLDDPEAGRAFEGGSFATLYLSPRDYHRIHAPLDGAIEGYTYVPGELWPVNPTSVRTKRALFCVNERLITHLQTRAGRVAVVAVGATCVGRIRAAYDDVVTHQGGARGAHRYAQPIAIKKGDELARFEMGSTVILLFERGRVALSPALIPGAVVRLGRRIGETS